MQLAKPDPLFFGADRVELAGFIVESRTAQGTGLRGDWASGGLGDDLVVGSHGNDVLMGGGGADLLVGGAGDDALSAAGARVVPLCKGFPDLQVHAAGIRVTRMGMFA